MQPTTLTFLKCIHIYNNITMKNWCVPNNKKWTISFSNSTLRFRNRSPNFIQPKHSRHISLSSFSLSPPSKKFMKNILLDENKIKWMVKSIKKIICHHPNKMYQCVTVLSLSLSHDTRFRLSDWTTVEAKNLVPLSFAISRAKMLTKKKKCCSNYGEFCIDWHIFHQMA